jgi:demethylmenaquinone methyltransferase/2-methoxy-6-polyprenyl-1,4-benzoquinol methylase
MNLPTGKVKKSYITTMFTGLSGNYDVVNSLCSLFIDHFWRSRAVRALGRNRGGKILDLCAGTLPLSRALLKGTTGNVVAVDISAGMLHIGLKRLNPQYGLNRLVAICGDGEMLPLRDQEYDSATVAFGIRNLAELDTGFSELHRVMRPGARLVILEFSTPPNPFISFAYHLYLEWVLIPVGTFFTGDRNAYQYLAQSIKAFPPPQVIAEKLQAAGFTTISFVPLTAGIVTLYTAERA